MPRGIDSGPDLRRQVSRSTFRDQYVKNWRMADMNNASLPEKVFHGAIGVPAMALVDHVARIHRGTDTRDDPSRRPISHWAGREHILQGRGNRVGKLSLWYHDDNTIRDSQGEVAGHHYPIDPGRYGPAAKATGRI